MSNTASLLLSLDNGDITGNNRAPSSASSSMFSGDIAEGRDLARQYASAVGITPDQLASQEILGNSPQMEVRTKSMPDYGNQYVQETGGSLQLARKPIYRALLDDLNKQSFPGK